MKTSSDIFTQQNIYIFLGRWVFIFWLNLFCLLSPNIALTQNDYHVTHLTVEDGLPSRKAINGFMDSKGYMWIATSNGLSRYDGKGFKNFLPRASDSNIIHSNNVRDIVEDKARNYWVLTLTCLYQFFPDTETFEHTTLDLSNKDQNGQIGLGNIAHTEDHTLWIGTIQGGFYKYNTQQDTYKHFNLLKGDLNSRQQRDLNRVDDIIPYIGDENKLWIGGSGLYVFDKTNNTLEKKKGVKDGSFQCYGIFSDQQGEVWYGNFFSGIYQYLESQDTVFKYPVLNLKNAVLDIINENKTQFLVAIHSLGVVRFDRENKSFVFTPEKVSAVVPKDENYIDRIVRDNHNRIWTFSWDGVKIYDKGTPFLKSYEVPKTPTNQERPDIAIQSVDVDSKGQYWLVGSPGRVFYKFDKDHNSYEAKNLAFPDPTPNPNHFYDFFDLLVDSKDDVWASYNCLYKFNHQTQKLEHFKKEQFEKLGNPLLWNMVEAQNGDLYMGTPNNGIVRFDRTRDSIIRYVSTTPDGMSIDTRSQVSDIFFDSKGLLLVSTDAYGIYIFDTEKEKFVKRIASVGKEFGQETTRVKIHTERRSGEYVTRTDAGFFLMDEKGNLNQEIKDEEGNSLIRGFDAVKDSNGNIWILNAKGLHRFDLEEKTRSFGKKEGIANLGGWETYFEILKNGEIFIGKKDNTFNLFHPDSLTYNNVPPKLVFDKIKIDGEELVLSKNLNYLNEITLDYAQNFFTISFAALNFTRPEKNQYAFMMEGLHDDWVMNGNDNKAAFTGLTEGNYTFKVKASNNDGIWNEEGISLKIKVLPPWYRSSLAYLFYLALLVGGIYFYWKFQKRRWQLHSQLQQEQAEAIRLKELGETKNRLYTNITHEFRTPLTVISGLAAELENSNGKKEKILNNSNHLLNLVNQILDLSKLQSGQLKYEPSLIEIIPYLNYLTDAFSSLANEKHISLIFHSEIKNLVMDTDPEKLKLVLGNLISNAIKYTPEFGKILVTALQNENKELVIKVKDSGIGISNNNLTKIFERFYQVDDAATRKGEGTGIGLAIVKEFTELMGGKLSVKSEINKGSIFQIILPIDKKSNKTFTSPIIKNKTTSSIEDFSKNEIPVLNSNDEKKNILIIEDNSDVAFYIENILNKIYQITHVRNGRLGVASAFENIPDFILCDVMMPEMDGFEVCEILKKDERTSHIPIILLTAKATQKDKLEGLQYGADAYLTKPFDKKELFIRIEQLLENQLRLQQYFSKNKKLPIEVSKENKFLKIILKTIQTHLSESDLGTTQLCRAVHLERSQLYRKIKALTGISPTELIRQKRLEHAQQLLISTEKNIAEIAHLCGYQNTSHFAKTYKEHFGKLPSATRK